MEYVDGKVKLMLRLQAILWNAALMAVIIIHVFCSEPQHIETCGMEKQTVSKSVN